MFRSRAVSALSAWLNFSPTVTIFSTPMTTFYCECDQYCNGERRQVSRSTFYLHKKKRDPLSHFSAPMQSFLKGKQVVISAPTPNSANTGTSRKSRKQGNHVIITNHTSSASNTRAQGLPHSQGDNQEADPGVSIHFLLYCFAVLIDNS